MHVEMSFPSTMWALGIDPRFLRFCGRSFLPTTQSLTCFMNQNLFIHAFEKHYH